MALLSAQLSTTELLTPYLGIFKFKPEEKIPFIAGQYLTLGVRRPGIEGPGVRIADGKGMVLRPYSVASSPDEEQIELYIAWVQQEGRRVDEWGMLSSELFNPTPDLEYLFMSRAKGTFLLPDDSRDVIMVATGTGIAPFVSMLRYQNKREDKRRFITIHGVARHSDLAYKSELENGYRLNVKNIRTISREEGSDYNKKYAEELFINRGDKTGRLSDEEVEESIGAGRITDTIIEEILGNELTPQNAVILLCGNPGMIKNLKKIAEAKDFKWKEDLITEEYW